MKAYETSATVEGEGQVRVVGVPFAVGTEVEVTISPKRRSAEEFTGLWRRVCGELQNSPAVTGVDDDDIQREVDAYRSGR